MGETLRRQVDDVDVYRAVLRREIEQDGEAVAHAATQQIELVWPDYERLTGPDAAEVQAWLRRAATVLLGHLHGKGVAPDQPEIWSALGALRARQGEPDTTVTGVIEALGRRVWRLVLERTAELAADGAVTVAVLLDMWGAWETAVGEAREGLLRGHRTVNATAAQRPEPAFVDRLLLESFEDTQQMRDAAARIGYRIEEPQTLLVLFPRTKGQDLDAVGRSVAGLFPEAIVGPTRRIPYEHGTVLTPSSVGRGAAQSFGCAIDIAHKVALDHDLVILILGPVNEPLRLAHELDAVLNDAATVDLTTATAAAVTWAEFNQHRLISRAPLEERVGLVLQVIGPVLDTPSARKLLATMNACFESITGREGAAQQLGIHQKTVAVHLGTVETATGLSFAVPRHAFRLFTAARLARTLIPELAQSGAARGLKVAR